MNQFHLRVLGALGLFVLFPNPVVAAPWTLLLWPGASEPQGEQDDITTDRPDFTEASSTVGRGRFQLESGYTYSRDRHGGVGGNHSYPEVLLRAGVFADWLEFRLGQGISSTFPVEGNGAAFSAFGFEDLYVGVKLGLTPQAGFLPEVALVIQTTVPTGSGSNTAGRILPGVNLLDGWDIVPDFLAIGGSTQGNRASDETGRGYTEFAQSGTVNYTLTDHLGAFTELFAFFPSGGQLTGVGPQYYFDGGFTYKLSPDFQLDIRAGVGLNRRADDFFVGSGFAVRF